MVRTLFGYSVERQVDDHMQDIIEIKDLHFAIDGVEILKHISAHVREKQRVGIIGPNGSGKTTLLKHIYRALPCDKKTVFIGGKAIEEFSYNESAKALTVVKQENSTDFDFTVEEVVMLGRAPYRKYFEVFTKDDRDIAERALASIGMTAYAKRFFNQLSGGEKQRVLIARSLAQEADIFVLDEPTNHLDVYYQWSLMQLIKELNTTVLGVFHELNLAAYFCDYLYVLANGEIVCSGKPGDVLTEKLLANVFRVHADIIIQDEGYPKIMINGAITA